MLNKPGQTEALSSPGCSASGYRAGCRLGEGQDVLITPILIETGKGDLKWKTQEYFRMRANIPEQQIKRTHTLIT